MESRRIVVIEDDPHILELLREALEGEGHEVRAYEHPRNVERLDASFEPDLIVVDLMLPGLSGVQVAEYLRENGYIHTPMVAMSADRLTLLFASRSGLFQDTLVKPFDLDALTETVRTYAGRHVSYPTAYS